MYIATEEAVLLVREAAKLLLKLPGVHTVGMGGRSRADRATGELVFQAYVSRKGPLASLLPGERVPREILGFPTDVVQCPPFTNAITQQPGALPTFDLHDRGRYRPLRGGSAIRGTNEIGTGLMGFIAQVQGDDSRVFGVTCHHCLFSSVASRIANMEVGQPTADDSFTHCCTSRFGKFFVGHYDSVSPGKLGMDVGLIQFNPGSKWVAEIKRVGLVTGTHPLIDQDVRNLDYQVVKYGHKTGFTGGTVQSIVATGTLDNRQFERAITVKPNAASGTTTPFFMNVGDSGSALVNLAGEIVGMMFATSTLSILPDYGWGTGMRIEDIIQKFGDDDQLTLAVPTATDTGQVHTVPGAAPAGDLDAPATLAPDLESELAESAVGRTLTELWLRHGREMNQLVNRNRRVTVAWHRGKGPVLLHHLMRSMQGGRGIPMSVDGKPADDCVSEVLDAFATQGSDSLRIDIERWRSAIPRIGGKGYRELLEELRTSAARDDMLGAPNG